MAPVGFDIMIVDPVKNQEGISRIDFNNSGETGGGNKSMQIVRVNEGFYVNQRSSKNIIMAENFDGIDRVIIVESKLKRMS